MGWSKKKDQPSNGLIVPPGKWSEKSKNQPIDWWLLLWVAFLIGGGISALWQGGWVGALIFVFGFAFLTGGPRG